MISNPSFMPATMRTRLFFLPDQTTDIVALILAVLAHGFLFLLLFLGLQWHTAPTYSGVEAEIWTELPQQIDLENVMSTAAPAVAPSAVPPVMQDADIVMAAKREQFKKEQQEKSSNKSARDYKNNAKQSC